MEPRWLERRSMEPRWLERRSMEPRWAPLLPRSHKMPPTGPLQQRPRTYRRSVLVSDVAWAGPDARLWMWS